MTLTKIIERFQLLQNVQSAMVLINFAKIIQSQNILINSKRVIQMEDNEWESNSGEEW